MAPGTGLGLARIGGVLVAAWAIGCGRAEVGTGEGAGGARAAVAGEAVVEEEGPPELLYVGCEAVQAGPVCMLRPDATLRVWLGVHPETPMRAELDGVRLEVPWVAAEDGLRAVFAGPVASGTLTLRAEDAGWKIELGVGRAEGLPAGLVAVQAAIDQGDAEAAARALDAAMPGLEGAGRAEGLKLRGDVAFVRGELQAALDAYEPAFAAAREARLLRRASEVALTASYLCTAVLYDLAGARRWLDRHAELVPLLPEARVRHGYYVGLVADWAGDLRTAQRSYEAQVGLVRALGLDGELAATLSALGVLRSRIGDLEGAEQAVAELLALGDRILIETRAMALHNAAWAAIEARARGQSAPDPEPQLAAAAAIFAPGGPRPDPLLAAEAQLNLVYAMLVRGDVGAARVALAATVSPTRTLGRWRDFLAARVALLEGDATAALRGFSAVAQRAAGAGERELEWSAAVGEGEALEKLGRDERALDRYRYAAAMHERDLDALAIDAGRERFAAERDRGSQRLVTLLLRLGRDREAMCAARRARLAGIAGLVAAVRDPAAVAAYRAARVDIDARMEASWELSRRAGERLRVELLAARHRLDTVLDAALTGGTDSSMERGRVGGASENPGTPDDCSKLRNPGPGELLLVFYPVDAGYVGFGLDEFELVVSRVPAGLPEDPTMRARSLLGPFEGAIARARRIKVSASGVLSVEGFHALPWAGATLIDQVAVAYSLDLPAVSPKGGVLERVVQLAPPSNLSGAFDELERSAAGLRAKGVTVERFTGNETDLVLRIAGADLFHYAGHARGEGWGGALELGGDRSLGSRDLLTIVAPRVAVLSGCETGLPDPRAHGGGMSLAHALLLAGAEAVLATDAVVNDEFGAALGTAVVLAIADGREPVEALADVQRTHRTKGWARFRAYTP